MTDEERKARDGFLNALVRAIVVDLQSPERINSLALYASQIIDEYLDANEQALVASDIQQIAADVCRDCAGWVKCGKYQSSKYDDCEL